MDPVTAFGLAGTVLQFIDTGANFVVLARQLYQRGADEAGIYTHLLNITESLHAILPELTAQDDTDREKSLSQLALDCGKTAERLLNILQRFKASSNPRKRDAVKAALHLVCKSDEIQTLRDQLSSYRNQLNLYLLLSLREHASKSTEQQEMALQKLGAIHDQTLNVGGIAACILEYLVSRTERSQDLVKEEGSPNHARSTESLKQALILTVYDIAEETDHFDPSQLHLSHAGRERAQSLFLASLQYDGMIDRESRIATAHESTFQWILPHSPSQDHNSPRMKWSNFREWMESENQLYWITGKAGSGKSTLMKFLCSPKAKLGPLERCRCRPYLERWSGSSGLIVASFYFWNSGMEQQMTVVGLLRTLLYEIVAQRPDILPVIALKQWESLCLFDSFMEHLVEQDLHDMLFRAVKALSDTSKICLFVDGLDEFGQNPEDLITMVRDLMEGNDHVKICVASRPWNIFQDAFKQEASLRLEDLTFDDIKNFVQSRFYADVEFDNMRQRYPLFANQLIDNIVVKASGVFLWVDLVVSSLLAGMRLGDRIQDFQRRLDELPPSLEDLYEKILQSLDPFYLEHAAQYFSLVESADTPITILQFSFADEESTDSAIKMRAGSITKDEISLRVESANRRLNSRCKGFLETDRGLQSIRDNDARLPSQLTVQYLHRTVRDFIKSPKAQEFLRTSTSLNFDPSLQLCVAYLMDMKISSGLSEQLRQGHFQDHLHETAKEHDQLLVQTNIIRCLKQAAGVSEAKEGAIVELLDELKSVINKRAFEMEALEREFLNEITVAHFQSLLQRSFRPGSLLKSPKNKASQGNGSETLDAYFLSLAVRCNIVPYVRDRAEWGGLIKMPSDEGVEIQWPVMLDALHSAVPEPRMIECLLDIGADPNFRGSNARSETPWTRALKKAMLLYTLRNEFDTSEEYLLVENKWKETLRLMFSAGADRMELVGARQSPNGRKILQHLKDEGAAYKTRSLPSRPILQDPKDEITAEAQSLSSQKTLQDEIDEGAEKAESLTRPKSWLRAWNLNRTSKASLFSWRSPKPSRLGE